MDETEFIVCMLFIVTGHRTPFTFSFLVPPVTLPPQYRVSPFIIEHTSKKFFFQTVLSSYT